MLRPGSFQALKAAVHDQIGLYPTLYRLCQVGSSTIRRRFVQPHTQLVIDGYPRSGNTFAYHAFVWAQEGRAESVSAKVAHHLHQPAQILRGVQLGVPTVALIRKPADSVLSYVIRHADWLDVETALKKYISFYTAIADVKDRIVLGEFGVVTRDFGRVIQQVNEKYEARFNTFDHTDENEAVIFRRIERVNRHVHGGDERGIARPSSYRAKLKERRREELARHSKLLQEAQSLYRYFVGNPVNVAGG